MVRVLVAASLIVSKSAVAEEVTLLQSLSRVSDQLKIEDSGGIAATQLDTTNRMVDTVLSFAQDPDTMARLPSTLIEAIANQSDAILAAVVAENEADQESIGNATQEVSQCNVDMTNSFTESAGIDELNADVYDARLEHATCRSNEDGAVASWQDQCDLAHAKSSDMLVSQPGCLASASVGIDTHVYFECLTETEDWVLTHYSEFQTKLNTCDEHKLLMDSYHSWCDKNQTHFETAYIAYAQGLDYTCTALDTCYAEKLHAHDQLKAEVQAKEISQKELFIANHKLTCLIAIFDTATSENLLAGAVEDCLSKDVDTSSLTITYPSVVAQLACDDSTATWNSTEYSAMNASHIEPLDSLVPTMATTTTTTTAATFVCTTNVAMPSPGTVSDGSLCVFPFYYNNRWWYGCGSAGTLTYEFGWCSTTEYYDGQWGSCHQGCPQDDESYER